MPSRQLLFLYRLARVHQEDRSYLFFLEVHDQSTAAVPAPLCYPSAHSERAIQVHTQNVLSKCTLRTYYPSAHSERAIQVDTQNVLSKCTVYSCTSCALYPRAPNSCTSTLVHPSRGPPISCTQLVHHLYSCIHCAPLHNLVHHYVISCTIVHHSCTTVHHSTISCTPQKLPQLSCTTQILIIATVNIVEILS